jgi:hypothetical protein
VQYQMLGRKEGALSHTRHEHTREEASSCESVSALY